MESKICFADKTTEVDNVLFGWENGYWTQLNGSNLMSIDSEFAEYLCELLYERDKGDYTWKSEQLCDQEPDWKNKMTINATTIARIIPGYGIKNLEGDVVYHTGIKFKKQRLYYDWYESFIGDGHYPFEKYDENYPSYIDYYFALDKEGYWVQQNGMYIQGIDGLTQKTDALAALNDGPDKGIGIKNKGGCILYSA
jgi:hypothetical protein